MNETKKTLIAQFNPTGEALNTLAWSPDCRYIAVGSNDKTIRIIDTENSSELFCLSGHSDWVKSVSFSHDGRRLASASSDQTVRIWDLKTGIELLSLEGHYNSVYSVSFSPDSKLLASGSIDQTIRIWDSETGNEQIRINGDSSSDSFVSSVLTVAFTPDGRFLASGSGDQTIRIWNPVTGKELYTLIGHSSYVRSLSFSPDCKKLASVSRDKTLRIWNLDSKSELRQINIYSDHVCSVSYSPDGQFIASGIDDSTICIWNPESGTELLRLEGHSDQIWSVSISPDGQRLASVSQDGILAIWDMTDLLQSLSSFLKYDNTLRKWLVRQSATLGCQVSKTDITIPNYWIPDKLLVNDGEVAFGEIQPKESNNNPYRLILSPNTNNLYTAHFDGEVRAWDLKNGVNTWGAKTHENQIWDITLSADGRNLALGLNDQTIRIWDTKTGTELHRYEGHKKTVSSVSYSPDGRFLASGSHDQTIYIRYTVTGKEFRRIEGNFKPILSLSFSPDSRRLATMFIDRTIIIWDTETGNEISRFEGNTSYVYSVSFSTDSRLLALAMHDQTIQIWNYKTGKVVRQMEGHSDFVLLVSFCPDGRRLASGSRDNTIRIWDIVTGAELQQFSVKEKCPEDLVWASSGAFLVTAHSNETIRIWDTRTSEMMNLSPSMVTSKQFKGNISARFFSIPKIWSVLHYMNIDLPLSIITELNALLDNEDPVNLKSLFAYTGVHQLIALHWPTPARTALIALLLHGWDCGPEWRPPKDIDTNTLKNKLTEALSGESCQPTPPKPPLEFLKVAANKIDDRMITLLRALGPKAVTIDPSLPLQLKREIGQIPILSQAQHRLLHAQIIPMSAGAAQGSGAGIDRSGYSRTGKLTSLLPSQFALPDDILLWRYLNGGLLYRAKSGQEPPQLRPVVIVIDTSPATLGPIDALIRPAALALASSLSQKYVPSIFLSAGDEKVFLLQTPMDRLKLLTHRHGKLGDPVKSIQKAEQLLSSLQNEHPLEPVILLLTHSFWGAEFEDAPKFRRLRALFVHYPDSMPRPPWANNCERWETLRHSDIDHVPAALGRLIG